MGDTNRAVWIVGGIIFCILASDLIWSAVRHSRADARLNALEQQNEGTADPAPGVTNPRPGTAGRASGGAGAPAVAPQRPASPDIADGTAGSLVEQLEDPEVRLVLEQVLEDYQAQERAEQQAQREDSTRNRVREEVAEFAAEFGLNETDREELTHLAEDSMLELLALHEAVRSGELESDEARTERDDLRAETRSMFVELVGEELADELMDEIRPGPPGPPPGGPR